MGASARPHQLLTQGGKGLFLGPLHRHRADLPVRRGGPEGEALKDGEPQGHGLGCGQLLHQALQRQPIGSTAASVLGLVGGQLIQLGVLRREVDGQGLTHRVRLTPMGRQLLLQWPDAIPPAGPLSQLLHGLRRRRPRL